jgi:hypothetical protein
MPNMRLYHLSCRCVPPDLDMPKIPIWCGLDPDHKGDHWYEYYTSAQTRIEITWRSERPDAYN